MDEKQLLEIIDRLTRSVEELTKLVKDLEARPKDKEIVKEYIPCYPYYQTIPTYPWHEVTHPWYPNYPVTTWISGGVATTITTDVSPSTTGTVKYNDSMQWSYTN